MVNINGSSCESSGEVQKRDLTSLQVSVCIQFEMTLQFLAFAATTDFDCGQPWYGFSMTCLFILNDVRNLERS